MENIGSIHQTYQANIFSPLAGPSPDYLEQQARTIQSTSDKETRRQETVKVIAQINDYTPRVYSSGLPENEKIAILNNLQMMKTDFNTLNNSASPSALDKVLQDIKAYSQLPQV